MNQIVCTDMWGSYRFNPHSPLLANEYVHLPAAIGVIVVSIHIRHCWRMNAVGAAAHARAGRFNPHSPLLANEYSHGRAVDRVAKVSIHIRHCWRMNFIGCIGSINSGLFQSTFAIAGE